jgi:hypothetical protein
MVPLWVLTVEALIDILPFLEVMLRKSMGKGLQYEE